MVTPMERERKTWAVFGQAGFADCNLKVDHILEEKSRLEVNLGGRERCLSKSLKFLKGEEHRLGSPRNEKRVPRTNGAKPTKWGRGGRWARCDDGNASPGASAPLARQGEEKR